MNSPITLKLSRCRVALCETKLSLIQAKKIVLRITETEVEIHNRLKWLDTNKNKLKAEELYLSTCNAKISAAAKTSVLYIYRDVSI